MIVFISFGQTKEIEKAIANNDYHDYKYTVKYKNSKLIEPQKLIKWFNNNKAIYYLIDYQTESVWFAGTNRNLISSFSFVKVSDLATYNNIQAEKIRRDAEAAQIKASNADANFIGAAILLGLAVKAVYSLASEAGSSSSSNSNYSSSHSSNSSSSSNEGAFVISKNGMDVQIESDNIGIHNMAFVYVKTKCECEKPIVTATDKNGKTETDFGDGFDKDVLPIIIEVSYRVSCCTTDILYNSMNDNPYKIISASIKITKAGSWRIETSEKL